jgi:HAMP domain-containing protein
MACKDCNQRRTGAKLLWPIVEMAAVFMLAVALKPSHRTPRPVAAGRISETPRAEVATEIDRAADAGAKATIVSTSRQ